MVLSAPPLLASLWSKRSSSLADEGAEKKHGYIIIIAPVEMCYIDTHRGGCHGAGECSDALRVVLLALPVINPLLHPVHWLHLLQSLQHLLVVLGHSLQFSLTLQVIQTAETMTLLSFTFLDAPSSPVVFVGVLVVHLALGSHDVLHLLQ